MLNSFNSRFLKRWCETPANSTEGAKYPCSAKQGALKTDANSFGTSFLGQISVVVVLLGLLSPTFAWAQSTVRTIAILNLSEAPQAAETTAQARAIVERTPGLRPTSSGDLARALEGNLPDGGPDAPVLARASSALAASEVALSDFKSRLATIELNRARELLFSLAPNAHTTKRLADVSFHMALIHLRANNMGLAMDEFRLHHRLNTTSKIDSVRFPPSVVRPFEQARKLSSDKTTAGLTISATYDGAPIFLDGQQVGHAPLELEVQGGPHIVSIAAPQYQAAAQKISLDPGDKHEIRIDLLPRSRATRALDLRFRAAEQNFDDASIRLAASRASRLVGSDAVLIILGSQSEAVLYIQEHDRLTYRSKVGPMLSHMLGLTLPVSSPTLLGEDSKPQRVPWYLHPVGIASLATVASLSIVGLLTLGTGDDTPSARNGTPIWDF